MMSTHQQSDFPPQWEPPPRVGCGEDKPALLDVMEAMTETPTADWVRQAYLSSFERVYLLGTGYAMDTQEWSRASKILDALPEGKARRKGIVFRDKYKEQIRRKNDEYHVRPTGAADDHQETSFLRVRVANMNQSIFGDLDALLAVSAGGFFIIAPARDQRYDDPFFR